MRSVVIDNLKAGVIKPCVYDPELNPKLRDFAAHYSTCILPSRVSKSVKSRSGRGHLLL
jgi:transposase